MTHQHSTHHSDSAMQEQMPKGTVLAFDYGKKRIGVAVGNNLLGVAQPLMTIDTEVAVQRFEAIAQLINTWQPVLLIVGLPVHSDGTEHEMTLLSQRFARRLAGRFNLKIILKDERYTSEIASSELRQAGIFGKKQKSILDQWAAQQILQSFFDERHATA